MECSTLFAVFSLDTAAGYFESSILSFRCHESSLNTIPRLLKIDASCPVCHLKINYEEFEKKNERELYVAYHYG